MVADADYKRIRWHSRRGMLELDLILMPFVEQHFPQLSDTEQQCYVKLLEQEDTDLFRWFLRAEQPQDEALAAIVTTILESVRGR